MAADPLSVRNLKFRRGQRHVREVRRGIKDFGDRNPYESVPDPNAEGRFIGMRVKRLPPPSVSISAGDALQDFKSALDHAVHELSRLHGATEKQLEGSEFLIADDAEWYRRHRERRLGPLPVAALTFIDGLQPFEGLDNTQHDRWFLRVLHHLARIDRHRHVHLGQIALGGAAAILTVEESGLDPEAVLALFAADPSKVRVDINVALVVSINEPAVMSPLPLSDTLGHVEATVRGILIRLADFRP